MGVSVLKIKGHIENYHWGKKGRLSLIFNLLNNADPDLHYAELWFGAHIRAPSLIDGKDKINLRDIIKSNPEQMLGKEVSEKFNGELPYLLKILSISKPLSLQLHPDKINAAILHDKDPAHYPDTNHKPEIAVAISEVHLLYGFRPVSEIKKALRKNPEFNNFIPESVFNEIQSARERNNSHDFISLLYKAIIHSNNKKFEESCKALQIRLSSYSKPNRHEKLALECIKVYGLSDPSIFTIFLMNYLVLHPGQAIFTAPNTLHAFIAGDLIECMANSDNVVRAGMTPKFKDLDTLERIIEYRMAPPKLTAPKRNLNKLEVNVFNTDTEEFELSTVRGEGKQNFSKKDSMDLILCIEGTANLLVGLQSFSIKAGEACVIPAGFKGFSLDCSRATLARVTMP